MIALTLTNLSKSYGVNTILQDISLTVHHGDKIGVVGPNGAGKSTLLRILAGEIPPSSGSTFVNRELRLGYLRQEKTMDTTRAEDGDTTVFDTARAAFTRLTAEGMELFESEVRGVLIGLGFAEDDLQKPAASLSGGERARLDIALLLLGKPHILLLDEPTNHLDLKGLAWLEGRIRAFRGTVLMISHDRYFLDRTVNRICELDGGILTSYGGGFENYRAEKRARMEAEARAYEKATAEHKRQEEMIRRFRQHKTEKLAKRAASREKKLAREGAPPSPPQMNESRAAKIDFAPVKRSGDDVLFAENLSISFSQDSPPLFTNVGLELKRGEKVCMIGANGIGKTTLLKILSGGSNSDTGETVHGVKVQIGYYDQHQEALSGEQNLLEEMRDCLPAWDDTDLRSLLGQFLFQGDKVFQTIASLSGGEKARLALLKLIVSGANTLLLDEPTNHLDIPSMEAIEDALLSFEGTLLIVSHDRYLLERIPDRILELTPSGLTSTLGNFHDYLAKKTQEECRRREGTSEGGGRPRSEGAERYQRAKAEEAARRKRENRLTRLEESIHTIEEAIADLRRRQLEEEAATDYALLSSLQAEISTKERELETVFLEWETLSELVTE